MAKQADRRRGGEASVGGQARVGDGGRREQVA